MLFNYLKLSFRLLVRNPFFTFINVVGLSAGFTVFIILWNYSQHELASDQFHPDYQRLFRICLRQVNSSGEWDCGAGSAEFIKQAAAESSTIEDYTRILVQGNFYNGSLPHRNQVFFFYRDKDHKQTSFVEKKIAYADANVFDIFSVPFLEGNPKVSLRQPNKVVLSETVARKYFGSDEPMGKVLFINDSIPLTVTGVFKDLPQNTHLNFEMLISMTTIEKYVSRLDSWAMTHGYYKLRTGANVTEVERALTRSYENIFKGTFTKGGVGKNTCWLQPVKDIAFDQFLWDQHTRKSYALLSILSLVSLVILTMAWVNHINLTLSSNQRRMRELAARKAVGATSRDFIVQFVAEALLINLISFLFALTWVQLVRLPAQAYFGFYLPEWKDFSMVSMSIIALTFSIGTAITGLSPALATVRISPKVLFGKVWTGQSGFKLGHWLTVLQYGSSITLIVWACAVYLQIDHILGLDIGVKKDKVVVVDLPFQQDSEVRSGITHFERQIATLPGIADYAFSTSVMGDFKENGVGLKVNPKEIHIWAATNGGVDNRFVPFYEIKILAGRNFLPQHPGDLNSILLSEKASRLLGFEKPEQAVEKNVLFQEEEGMPFRNIEVIGVYADYHAIAPLYKWNNVNSGSALTPVLERTPKWKVSVRIADGNLPGSMAQIQKAYSESFPKAVFNWYFLDDHISHLYGNERTTSNQIIIFTLTAIGIACLGLLAMISNKVVEKTKEIGIRKVMGASMHHLAYVLINTSLKQILLSMIIGLPLAWYLSDQYLDKFSERITLQWWHYAMPAGLLLLIMFCTIASLLFRAAKANPVESLRYE